MNTYSTISVQLNEPVSVITFNRPEVHNAFNDFVIEEIDHAMDEIEKKPQIRVVFINANGQHFSAGADLKWMQHMINYSFPQNKKDALKLAYLLQRMAQFPKPIIALVHGRAMGGGCGIIACCDIVLADEEARFAFTETKLGLIPATISPYVLRRIGYPAALRYFITAELFDATEAKKINLVDVITTRDELVPRAQELAKLICQNGPSAIMQAKKLLNELQPVDDQVIDETATRLAQIRISNEAQEGLTAFLNKRKPNWCKDLE